MKLISILKKIKNIPASVIILLLLITTGLLIFWPILFGGKIINDAYGFDFGAYKFFKEFGGTFKSYNELQLWWSSYVAGYSVYLTQMGLFSPLVLIFYKIFSGFTVYNWLTFINFILGGLCMYWLSRNLKLSKIASIICGLAYVFSQNNLYWGATLPFTNTYLFIPLFFLVLLKISENKKLWWFWGILVTAYGLAATEIQIVFFTLVIGFFWVLFLTYFHNFDYGHISIAKFKPIFGYLVVVAGGAVLASFWLLPVLNYLKFTLRSSALSFENLVYDFMKVVDPLRFFYPFIQLPQFTGLASLSLTPNYYIGVLTFLLAVASLFLIKKNKTIAFFSGVAAFSFFVRIKWTGIFWALHFLPGFNRFKGAFHWAFMSTFALVLLAGFGLDNLEHIKESKYFKKFISTLKIFAWANIIGVAILFFTGLLRNQILDKIFQFFDAKVYSRTRQFPLEHYHNVITAEFNKFLDAFSFANYHFVVSFFSILIAILIFVLYQRGKINFDNFKKYALAFTFVSLVLIWQGYYNFIPQSKITNYPDTVSFIKAHLGKDEHYRFFRFYPPESYQAFEVFDIKDWTDYKLKTLESNIGLYFDMDTFGGVESFLSARIANVFDEIGLETTTTIAGKPWLRSTTLSLDEKISRFTSPENQNLFSMLNIKYIFSSFKLPNFKLIYETTATEKNIPVYVYENPEVMPRIYFAKTVKYVDSKSDFSELLSVRNFHELTLIECQKDCPVQSSKLQVLNSVVIEEFQPQLVKTKTKSDQGRWLVYSDANLPTWEAYIDNQKTPIYTANYLFKAVFVPKGEHEVIFKYPNLWEQDIAALKSILGRQ